MIVVSDTTPLNYLILIGQAGLLPRLYRQVMVPKAVVAELNHDRAPQSVKTWIENPPAWLEIREVAAAQALQPELDPGELEALALAEDLQSIDEISSLP